MDLDSQSSNKPEQKIAEQAAPRAPWRTIVLRTLRYSFVALFAAITLLTAAMWARSYNTVDRIIGPLRKENIYGGVFDRGYLIGSNRGEIAIATFTEIKLQWKYDSAETDAPWRLIAVHRDSNSEFYGLKKFETPLMMFIQKSDHGIKPDSVNYDVWQRSVCTNCPGIVIPHWMLLLVFGSLFTLFLLGLRFSLRAFLIWVTIVCVILAIAVRTSGDSSQKEDRSVQDGT